MATEQAVPKGVELVNEIVDLAKAKSPSSFEIARLRKQAQSLISLDAYHASMALGMLAGMSRNELEMRQYHQQAIRLRSNSVLALMNFAGSLERMNFYSEVREIIAKAHIFDPSDIRILDNAIQSAAVTGQFNQCNALIAEWKKLRPTETHKNEKMYKRILDYLSENNISESEIDRLIEIASANLRQAGVFSTRIDLGLLCDEGPEWLNYDLILSAPVEQVVELNTKLAEGLAGIEPPIPAEQFVNVMYLTNDDQ